MKAAYNDIYFTKTGMLKKYLEYIVVAVSALIFTLYHAVLTSLVISGTESYELSFLYIFAVEWIAFLPLGVAMVLVISLSKRRPEFFSRLKPSFIFGHIGVALVVFVIHNVWQVYMNSIFLGTEFGWMEVVGDFMSFLEMRFLAYVTIVGLVAGLIKIREQRKIVERESELRLELQKARLKEVELRLNPEIIYPNLRFIREKAKESAEEASQMVILMAGILRKLVDNMDEEKVSVSENTQLFRMYSNLVKLRLGKSLDVDLGNEKFSGTEKIPSLILFIPMLERVLFGEYQLHTHTISGLGYHCKGSKEKGLAYTIFIDGIENGKELLTKLETEEEISNVVKLLEGFSDQKYSLKYSVTANRLELIVSVIEEKELMYA